jgi:hypothetical protein
MHVIMILNIHSDIKLRLKPCNDSLHFFVFSTFSYFKLSVQITRHEFYKMAKIRKNAKCHTCSYIAKDQIK